MTGDAEGLIKVWNYRKELIREVKFTEPVSAVCFQDEEGNLLVGHEGKLSRIEAKNYLPATTITQQFEKTATGLEQRFSEVLAFGLDQQLTKAEILQEMRDVLEEEKVPA